VFKFYYYLEYITEEEIQIYESLQSLPGDWEKQEEMLINLKNIEYSREKLTLWSFIYDIEEHMEGLENQILSFKVTFEAIRGNENLKNIFSYILTIGNILNGGTIKGQADGFNLDILTKLNTMKDNSNKSILQIVCIKIKNDNENFGPMKKTFEKLEDSLKIPSNENKLAIDKFLKEAIANKALVEKISLGDEFCKLSAKTIDNYLNKLKILDETFKKSFEYAQKTVEFFGYPKSDAKYRKPDEFLQLINDFLGDLDRAIPLTEAKKAFKGAAEMGKKITDNKNPNMNSLLNGIKAKLGNSG